MKFVYRIFPAVIFLVIFGYVILVIPYPETLTQANFYQIAPFFVSLFFALLFSFNIFLKKILLSGTFSLGIIFLLALKGLDSLNVVTGLLTLAAIYFLVDYFRKVRRNNHTNLTRTTKIPKLTQLRK